MKLDIIAFGAHPDDVELNCGGTVGRLIQQGFRVGIVDLTQGEMGTRGTPETRTIEAKKAGSVLGIQLRENLRFNDSDIINDRKHQLSIIEIVRNYKPDICLIGAPHDRHPDHGKATDLLKDALFYSGLSKIETGNLEAWRPSHILHYMQDRPFEPDFIFDISSTIDLKMDAIKAYETQFNVTDPNGEPETYISSENYFEQIKARAKFYGHLSGFEYGEPFKYYNGPIPINSFQLFSDTKPNR